MEWDLAQKGEKPQEFSYCCWITSLVYVMRCLSEREKINNNNNNSHKENLAGWSRRSMNQTRSASIELEKIGKSGRPLLLRFFSDNEPRKEMCCCCCCCHGPHGKTSPLYNGPLNEADALNSRLPSSSDASIYRDFVPFSTASTMKCATPPPKCSNTTYQTEEHNWACTTASVCVCICLVIFFFHSSLFTSACKNTHAFYILYYMIFEGVARENCKERTTTWQTQGENNT